MDQFNIRMGRGVYTFTIFPFQMVRILDPFRSYNLGWSLYIRIDMLHINGHVLIILYVQQIIIERQKLDDLSVLAMENQFSLALPPARNMI